MSRNTCALGMAWAAVGVVAGIACSSGGGGSNECDVICKDVSDCGSESCISRCVSMEAACTVTAQSSSFQDWAHCGPRFVCEEGEYVATGCPGQTKAVLACEGGQTGTTTGTTIATTTGITTGMTSGQTTAATTGTTGTTTGKTTATTTGTTTGKTTATTTGTTTGTKMDGGGSDGSKGKKDASSGDSSGGSSNLVSNGDFSMGTTDWGISLGSGILTVNGNMACVQVEAGGVSTVVVLGWPYAGADASGPGANLMGSYTFSYTATATTAIELEAKVGQTESPYAADVDIDNDVVSATPTTFMHPFMTTDSSAGVAFVIPALQANTVCFQNVSIVAD